MGGNYSVNGALAEQLKPQPRMRLVERQSDLAEREQPNLSQAIQGTLFQASNVIAMPPRLEPPKTRVRTDGPAKPATTKTTARRAKPVPEGQGTLDFLPPAPAKPRQLGTSVEAVIYCEAPVATTLHRAVACALDWSMVIIAYAVFLGVFSGLGGQFELTRANLSMFGGMFLLTGFTYGFLFAWAGSETPGMLWAQLKLTTFDGFPPDRRQRMVRFIASSLSRTTLLGLLWSLADEESLAWHDHISRTFPTLRDSRTLMFRDER